jgi:hypothetical protein
MASLLQLLGPVLFLLLQHVKIRDSVMLMILVLADYNNNLVVELDAFALDLDGVDVTVTVTNWLGHTDSDTVCLRYQDYAVTV